MTESSEANKTVSEAALEVEDGRRTTRKVEDTEKKAQDSTIERVTYDDWEKVVQRRSHNVVF